MDEPSNPAPLYLAIGWVGNLLPLSFFSFNLCVLPRSPPGLRIVESLQQSSAPKKLIVHAPRVEILNPKFK